MTDERVQRALDQMRREHGHHRAAGAAMGIRCAGCDALDALATSEAEEHPPVTAEARLRELESAISEYVAAFERGDSYAAYRRLEALATPPASEPPTFTRETC